MNNKHFIFLIIFAFFNLESTFAQFYIQAKSGMNLYFQSLNKSTKNDEYLDVSASPQAMFGISLGLSHNQKLFWDVEFAQNSANIAFQVSAPTGGSGCGDCIAGLGLNYGFKYQSLSIHAKYKLDINSKFSILPLLGLECRFYSRKIKSYTTFHDDPYLKTSMVNRQVVPNGEFGIRYGTEFIYAPHPRHHIVLSLIHNIGTKPFVKSDISFQLLSTGDNRHYTVQQKGDFLGIHLGYRFFIIK